MFEKELQRRIRVIFGVKKNTYNAPDETALEQDCIFIQVLNAQPRMTAASGGRQVYKVKGYLTLFSQHQRTPFGFFYKKLEQANPDDSRLLIFGKEMDIPESPARIQNLQERRIEFTFLYDSEYDPNRGSLTTLQTSVDIQE